MQWCSGIHCVGITSIYRVGTQVVTIFYCQAVDEYCVTFGFGGGIAVYHHTVVLPLGYIYGVCSVGHLFGASARGCR